VPEFLGSDGLPARESHAYALEKLHYVGRYQDIFSNGMKNWRWGDRKGPVAVKLKVNSGSGNSGGHVQISARELARFGHLVLNSGKWDGKQLISSNWITAATTVQVPASIPWAHPESDIDGRGVYAFNWWRNGVRPDGKLKFPNAPGCMFWAAGHNNNKCFVIPEWNMVIVRMGTIPVEVRDRGEKFNTFFARMSQALRAASR